MDRIDPLFYARSKRIDLQDETRIKATSEEASKWAEEQQDPNGGWFPHEYFSVKQFYSSGAFKFRI
jgi:hypothetical protein